LTEVMEKEKVRDIIKDVISGNNVAYLATVSGDKPWVRYVMVYNADDNLNLFCSTSLKSRKVEHIRENPNVHLTLGWNHIENKGPYIQYEGKAVIHTDPEIKKKHWHPALEDFFRTPENPDYCILEFSPDYVEVWGYMENPMEFLTYKP